MDSARLCPSPPPKILVADKVRPNEQTTVYMAAHGCHFVECSLYVLFVNIEVLFLAVREPMIARTLLYKVSIAIVSRQFFGKTITAPSILPSSQEVACQYWLVVRVSHPYRIDFVYWDARIV